MIATILIGCLVLGVVTLAIRSIIRDKKKGKLCSCGGDCSKCGGCVHHT